jgi:uncharacterized phage infection (PIP) family protein YhgE
MAKEYNVGDRLYLPVWVTEKETNVMMGPDKSTTITDAKFSYAYWHGKTGEGKVRYGEDGLLLTATEIAEKVAGRRCAECYPTYDEVKARNEELEALLKEVMATRDEAIRQNDELIAENIKLKADCNEWKDTANERLNAVQTLSAERNKVMAGVDELKNTLVDRTKDVQHLTEENAKLKAWYEEANRTASEAAVANDELKAKIADLRNRVGEQLAQIQDLNAEVHFLKEKGGKPTDEATKHAHVVLNDGTELAFTQKDTIAFYRDDVDMLFISDGDGVIAGFNRGDKPTNFAYFY